MLRERDQQQKENREREPDEAVLHRVDSKVAQELEQEKTGKGEQHEKEPGYDVRRVVEVVRGLDLRGAHGVHRAEHGDEADVLLHGDEVVHERGRDPPHRLGQHDAAQGLSMAEAE